VIMWDASCQEE